MPFTKTDLAIQRTKLADIGGKRKSKRGRRKAKRRKKRRKTKRKKIKKKRVCCVGPGCPEWKHCIHVLGDGRKYKPKKKSTLKRMKKCLTRYAKSYKKCMKREHKKNKTRKK